jgi:hypothetical protein
MGTTRNFECWFGVGEPDGKHSMVWKVFASRHTPDVYVTARPRGGTMKVSIHKSGERLMGLMQKDRERWYGGYHLEGDATLEFLVRFPTAELRQFPLGDSDMKSIVWLTPAPEPEALEIGLFYFPPEPQPVFYGGNGSTQLVGTGRLSDSRQVWLVARIIRAVSFKQPQALQEIAKQMRADGIMPSTLGDEMRLIVPFNDSGVRGWTEMAAVSIGNATIGGT